MPFGAETLKKSNNVKLKSKQNLSKNRRTKYKRKYVVDTLTIIKIDSELTGKKRANRYKMKDRISNTSSNQKKTNANKEFEGEKVKAKRKKKGKMHSKTEKPKQYSLVHYE